MKLELNWRAIIATSLFFGFLIFHQYFWLFWIGSFLFSIVITVLQRHQISQIIKDNVFFGFATTLLSMMAYFFAKVSAIHHFNAKYGIFAEYLNHAATAWAGFIGTIFLISIPCFLLAIYFFVQSTKKRQLKELVKGMELVVHTASCLWICLWLPPVYQFAEKHDKILLLLDAYEYSDCQAPKNRLAIRRDDKTCYLIVTKEFLEIELQPYSSKKP